MWSYLPAKFVFFLKSGLIFERFCCFCMFVNKHFTNAGAYNSKSKRCLNAKHLAYYFYIKTKISLGFHICISVPLIRLKLFLNFKLNIFFYSNFNYYALVWMFSSANSLNKIESQHRISLLPILRLLITVRYTFRKIM